MPDITHEDDTMPEDDMNHTGSDDEAPQESPHPNLTRPRKELSKTEETLNLLGAGQPYKSRNV